MTNPIDPSHVTRLVDSARRALEQAGESGHDVRLVGPPVVTARSRLYLLGRIPPTADYVLKEPLAGDAAVDTDPPLSARAQFEALKLASAWQGAGSAVSRPVALLEGSGAFLMEHVSGRSFTRGRPVVCLPRFCSSCGDEGCRRRTINRSAGPGSDDQLGSERGRFA